MKPFDYEPGHHPADWLHGYTLTEAQRDCIAVLVEGLNLGIYNIITNWKKADFSRPDGVVLNIQCNVATFDFNQMTRLVIGAHDKCVRVQISSSGPRLLQFMLHKRKGREGGMAERHPSLDQAIARFRGTEQQA